MSYYSTTILGETLSPLLYYRLDESGGLVAVDATNNNKNGTYVGTLTYNQTGAIHGDSDTCINFTGGASVNVPFSSFALSSLTAISIEFWIKLSSSWQYVVITANQTTTTLYLNGSLYTSGSSGDTILIGQDLSFVGSAQNGYLDEVVIYPGILSPAQILKHYLIANLLTSGSMCLYANGTGSVLCDTLRVTQYPDPSTSLANVGRAAYSNMNWNANQPANTNIIVTTSLDNGITYQPSTNGNDIWGLTVQLFATQALQQQPLAYFRLDDTGTSIADLSGNNNTGTASGGVFFGKSGALMGPGEQNDTSMLFDGTSGSIALPSGLSLAGLSTISIAFWINPTALSGYRRILSNAYVGGSQTGLEFLIGPDGTVYFTIGNGTSNASVQTSTPCPINTWTFLVGTYDGINLRLYKNGSLQNSSAFSGNIAAASNNLTLGKNPSYNGDYYSGYLDEVLLYTRTLSAAIVAQLYNLSLSGIGQTVNDSFTSDTSASYTKTSVTSNGVWIWNTSSSNLEATGGADALLLYNNIYAYENSMLVDFYQAENGGVVWCYQNPSTFYLLKVNDSGASSSPNMLILQKWVNGTPTTLASTSVSFPTQTHHRVFIDFLSATITVSFDENQVLSYTDTNPLLTGLCGLYNSLGNSTFYLFQFTPQPADVSKLFLVTKQSLLTTDPTATPQITDHQGFAGDKNFATGVTIPQADYRQTVVSENFDDLNTQSNYWWRINDGAQVEFKPQDADDAPFILQPQDVLTGTMPSVEYSGDMYRNEQRLTGVYDTGTFTEIKLGDGSAKTWNVANPIIALPTIQLNGASATVGIQGTDTGKSFYYQANSNSITQDNSLTTLTSNDVLIITYQGTYNIDFSINNTGQFPSTITQQDMAAIDGTSGIVTAVEDVSQKNMNKAAATVYANQLLQRYGTIARTITFQTLHNGLRVGHSLPIFIPQLNIFDSVFLVVKISTSARTLYDGSTQYVYDVTASEAAALSSWQKLFSRVMSSVKGKAPHVKA